MLKVYLVQYSLEELKKLAKFWDLDVEGYEDKTALMEALYKEMISPESAGELLYKLDKERRGIIEMILEEDGRCQLDFIYQRSSLPPDEIEEFLYQLDENCFLFFDEDKGQVEIYEDILSALRIAQREMEEDLSNFSLAQILARYKLRKLRAIAERRKLSISTRYTRKEDIVRLMADNLKHLDSVQLALGEMGELARKVYQQALAEDGELEFSKLEELCQGDLPKIKSLIRGFEERALAFSTYRAGNRKLIIPKGIVEEYKALGEIGEVVGKMKKCPPPSSESEVGLSLIKDMEAYLNYLRNNEVSLNRSNRRFPKRVINELDKLFSYPESLKGRAGLLRFAFINYICKALSLIKQEGLSISVTPAVDTWLRLDTLERINEIYYLWYNSKIWNEIEQSHLSGLSWNIGEEKIFVLREIVITDLKTLAINSWYHLDDFIGNIKAESLNFMRPEEGFLWEIYDSKGENVSGLINWERVEGKLISDVITRVLHWLGAISSGYNDDNMVSFKITKLGAWLIGALEREDIGDILGIEGSKEVKIYKALVLEFENEDALRGILGDEEIASYLKKNLSPTKVLAMGDKLNKLVRRLRDKGYKLVIE